MTRLNQVVALEAGAKGEAVRALETTKGKAKLDTLLAGISRTYQPRDEEGDRLPPESTQVQVTVAQMLADLRPPLQRLYDLTATKERANMGATAGVIVDGQAVLTDVPIVVLLFLERQLGELRAVVQALPVLDPAEQWSESEPGVFHARERLTARTVKLPRAFVRYEATKEHPAQVDVVNDDKVVGDWTTIKFSGAMRAADKAAILERIRKLTAAVLTAREEANSVSVTDEELGAPVLAYLFG